MAKKDLVKEFNEMKEKLRPEYEKNEYQLLHDNTFSHLLNDADKKTTLEVIDGIAKNKFATNQDDRFMEVFATLPYIIRDNINDKEVVSASFKAMEIILNTATDYIKNDDREKAVYEVNTIQDATLTAIANLRDLYPSKLSEYTDSVYEVYKNMMKEYAIRGLQNDEKNCREISDYYHGFDPYKDVKEFEAERRQVDAAWETKERLEAAKQRIYDKFTKREVADYEQRRAKQAKSEDAQYTAELREFVREHGNPALRKKRNSQMDEAWSQKERGERAQKDFDKAITDRLITDYEKEHAAQIKKEDTQYRAELKGFIENYDNRKLNEKHQEQITEIKLKHSDLNKIYNDYKNVARKPEDGKTAKEIPISGKKNKISKRAVFLARVENKRQA